MGPCLRTLEKLNMKEYSEKYLSHMLEGFSLFQKGVRKRNFGKWTVPPRPAPCLATEYFRKYECVWMLVDL